MNRNLVLFLATMMLIGCGEKDETLFEKVNSSVTHITFKNTLKSTPELNILTYLYYYNGAGVAAADFNNDNLVDLYFTSNSGADKLYLNKGNLVFTDITEIANIKNLGSWSTGVTYTDINNDGLLDIYVCKASGYRALKGRNLLYINLGPNKDGVPVFKEDATSYGLDFSGLSTQAAFLDYDLDGDLDMYLMNHSVHPNNAYGKGSKRKKIDSLSGDRLYENIDQKFVDVSKKTGIFQGKIGYGLGLGVSDLNGDNYPDIYIGNDFFENDYLYINQKNGTFKEMITSEPHKIGHTSHFSMGNDIADINNDGLVDILSVDMLPEDLETYKSSGSDFSYSTYENYIKNGYARQYIQNTLQLNLGNSRFSEIGHLSGISATEWSWSPLLADFDNDGLKDIFITNGIKGATNDMDFVKFISNDAIQKSIDEGMSKMDMKLIDKIPQIKVPNYLFKNLGNLKYENVSDKWVTSEPSFSNGSIYADLDNDGDLDIVVNNVDDHAFVLENKATVSNNYIKIYLHGEEKNPLGIGAKLHIYASGKYIFEENYNTRGYLSSISPDKTIGLGQAKKIDSLIVVWPNGYSQKLKDIEVNKSIDLHTKDAKLRKNKSKNPIKTNTYINAGTLLNFSHKDKASLEFYRNPLTPYATTNEGPSIAVADVDKNGKTDIFIAGAKNQASAFFLQDSLGRFNKSLDTIFENDSKSEDVSQVFFDANNDGWQDLLVVSGGNEYKNGKPLIPRLYINRKGVLAKDSIQFKNLQINASKVDASDIDNDGDFDITITSDAVPAEFGATPVQYILKNDGKGNFKDVTIGFAPDFRSLGNVKDFVWQDIDDNGYKDLIVVGHWMPLSIFYNTGKRLVLQSKNGLEKSHGLWNTLTISDFDKDGDLDIVAGNFGLNSKLKASPHEPLSLYRKDFDQNNAIETLVTYYYKGKETTFASKDELTGQLPYLNKKFLSYGEFAKADIHELFGQKNLRTAEKKEVYSLASTYFENQGDGVFTPIMLPMYSQSSTIQDIALEDFNKDGFTDLLLVGNNYEINTQLGRMDALQGVILQNDKKGRFYWDNTLKIDVPGPARDIQRIHAGERNCFVIAINNGSPIFLCDENQ
ncbi:VCBS repeat-containing protein [Costertonia aggregata]|uniref:VCBS repeat-containing protein n=1 Tax=Costertonia aggregata TaxID=343403 RepID=A0A7H9AQQ3_9FLAO|nr:VCBS repeat-containing protein [Costertonia aggregata]QLG45737.1 VCBS repeat-containing protein [Costertonia aggregata]